MRKLEIDRNREVQSARSRYDITFGDQFETAGFLFERKIRRLLFAAAIRGRVIRSGYGNLRRKQAWRFGGSAIPLPVRLHHQKNDDCKSVNASDHS